MDHMTAPDPFLLFVVSAKAADAAMLRQVLEGDPEHSYHIEYIGRGDVALQQCQAQRPDCVVVGEDPPDMDSMAFITAVRSVGTPPIPVVLLLDTADAAVAAQAFRQGAYACLSRNDAGVQVQMILRNAVETARLRMEAAQRRLALEENAAQLARLRAERDEALLRDVAIHHHLNETLALLDTLIESAPAGLAFAGRDLRYVWINRTLAAMNALPPEAHIGRRPSELFGALGAQWEQFWQRVIDTGEPILNVEASALLHGQRAYALVSYYPVRDIDDAVIGVGTVVTDISQRKRMEIGQYVLALAGSALSASLDAAAFDEAIRALIPELATYALLHLVDEGGQLQLVAYAHIDPAVEPRLANLFSFERLARHGPDHPIVRAVAQGLAVRNELPMPEDAAVSAALRPSASVIAPLIARGRCYGALTVVTAEPGRKYVSEEIVVIEELARRCALTSEAMSLYREAQQARAAAEAVVEVRDRFISTAAHELKTPLAVLLRNVQLLLRRAEQNASLEAATRRNLTIIMAQALRLNRLIATLLDISRLESDRLVITPAPVDLGAVARRLAEEITPTLIKHTISLDIPAEPVLVAGDELRLEQVVQNLLHNAIKYSPHGGDVRLVVQVVGDEAILSVTDQGIGIPADDLPYLFQRGFRAANAEARHIAGIGFGLFVVREIVESHGGTIEVQSVEGQGSTFTVRLPLLST